MAVEPSEDPDRGAAEPSAMADPSLVTPAVEAALQKAGPKVAAALGMDAVAGVADVATVGEAGLNPLADGAAVVAQPIAAAKDAEAIAGAEGVLQALAKSPAGKALLEKSGKTVEEIAAAVGKRGPDALKEALDTPAGKGVLSAMKEAWDKLPPQVRGTAAAGAAYVGTHVIDTVAKNCSRSKRPRSTRFCPRQKRNRSRL